MTKMKMLKYAYDAAIMRLYQYDKIARKCNSAESIARKLADETMADVKELAKMIHAEEYWQKTLAEIKAVKAEAAKYVRPVDYEVLVETNDANFYSHYNNEHDATLAYEKARADMKLSKKSNRVSLMREYVVLKSVELA